jgi:hypothetical protein
MGLRVTLANKRGLIQDHSVSASGSCGRICSVCRIRVEQTGEPVANERRGLWKDYDKWASTPEGQAALQKLTEDIFGKVNLEPLARAYEHLLKWTGSVALWLHENREGIGRAIEALLQLPEQQRQLVRAYSDVCIDLGWPPTLRVPAPLVKAQLGRIS